MQTFLNGLNERGAGSFKVYLFLFLLFIVVHVGVKLVPMYMDFERMKDEMSIKASVAQVLKDEDIRSSLVKKARELELPLGPENFILTRDDENHLMTIGTKWDVEVHFLFDVYIRNFHFEPVVSEDTTMVRK